MRPFIKMEWSWTVWGVSEEMLSGYNHNVSHGGQTFHVQTEDFGREKSYFLTQIFLGGTLVAKERHFYQDLLGEIDPDPTTDPIRARIRIFHKQMIEKLVAGDYDLQTSTAPSAIAQENLTDYRPSSLILSPEELEAFIMKLFVRLPI